MAGRTSCCTDLSPHEGAPAPWPLARCAAELISKPGKEFLLSASVDPSRPSSLLPVAGESLRADQKIRPRRRSKGFFAVGASPRASRGASSLWREGRKSSTGKGLPCRVWKQERRLSSRRASSLPSGAGKASPGFLLRDSCPLGRHEGAVEAVLDSRRWRHNSEKGGGVQPRRGKPRLHQARRSGEVAVYRQRAERRLYFVGDVKSWAFRSVVVFAALLLSLGHEAEKSEKECL